MHSSKQRKLEAFVRNQVIMRVPLLIDDLLEASMYGEKVYGGVELDEIENLYITTEAEAQEQGYTSLAAMQEAGEDRREISEWWFVTAWLFGRLRAKGEPVIDSDYGYLWGRTCTGQAIFLDAVIEEIFDDTTAEIAKLTAANEGSG
ncbi:MAG: hypothetical protein OES12_09545 [Anaerolineae bacterium]|nr:hypothetical protein [Anaerolineae bacterium]